MKNLVSAFVFALTLTGMGASAMMPSSTVQVAKPTPTSMPVPYCPPGDPHGCGIGR